jgi:glycosyltransferase involved in cell wall biosynthesis
MRAVDVLIVGLGSTAGLRTAEDELADGLRRAGATVAVVRARPPREVRTFVLTDLMWARAARAAADRGVAAHDPRAIVFSTVTAALLWPRSTAGRSRAIRYDAPAAANRPGRHGLWQRPRERRRLRSADLLLPQSEATLSETPEPHAPAIVVGIPVEPSAAEALAWAQRDVTAVTYAANWEKKGLDRVLAAWAVARRDGEALVVCGADDAAVGAAARRTGLDGVPEGVVARALLAPREYRALVRRARVYVTAPRREDHGVAQLEALADGCALVSTAGPGPSVALSAARSVDPRWVVPDAAGPDALAAALRAALDDPPADVEAHALAAIASHRRAAIDAVIAGDVLPALLGD